MFQKNLVALALTLAGVLCQTVSSSCDNFVAQPVCSQCLEVANADLATMILRLGILQTRVLAVYSGAGEAKNMRFQV